MTTLAIIGGSGLSQLQGFTAHSSTRCETPFGSCSADLASGELDGKAVLFLPRHGHPHSIPPHKINYRANIWALKEAGASGVIAVNVVGGISDAMEAGVICIPDQIVDYSYGREHSYSDSADVPLQHVDFSEPYDRQLRQYLLRVAKRLDIHCLDAATMAVTQGPRLESAAEIRRLERDGCDIVGMTAMPEAGLARELELPYASIGLVVNRAAGKEDKPITMDDINRAMAAGMGDVRRLLAALIREF